MSCIYCGTEQNLIESISQPKEYKYKDFSISAKFNYYNCKECNNKNYLDKVVESNKVLRLLFAKILKEKKIDEIIKYQFEDIKERNSVIEIIQKNDISKIVSDLVQLLSIPKITIDDGEDKNYEQKPEKITCILDFINIICDKYKNKKNIKLWYRGQKNSDWELVPGAFRKESEIFLETKKYEYFRLNAQIYNQNIDFNNNGKLLAFMQHYGVNTRLLDWTESPLCALYFALNNHDYETDAAIFCLDVEKLNSLNESLNNNIPTLGLPLYRAFNENYIEHGFYDGLFPFELYPVGVKAVKQFDRIHNQQGNFTIHTNSIDMYALLPDVVEKFIIPVECIQKIQSQLYILGINETMFFNEIEGLANITNNPLYINNDYKL